MPRYISPDFVLAAFKDEGFDLLDRFTGNHVKMRFVCPEGHQHSITWNNFLNGRRCGICAGRYISHESVREAFSKEGYTVLSSYTGSKSLIKFICPKGHNHHISWGSFRQGFRCAACAGKHVFPHEVRDFFEKEGYELLNEYTRANEYLNFVCPEGHEHKILWSDFKKGLRCGICAGKNLEAQRARVKESFKKEGYILLSQYSGSTKPLRFICPKGHETQISWSSFNRGSRCINCSTVKRGEQSRLSIEYIKKSLAAEGYTLLSDYSGCSIPFVFLCKNGHTHEMTWDNFKSGGRCGICHTENFYHVYKNRVASRIISSVSKECEKQKNNMPWRYFYDREYLISIAEKISSIYEACPKGHQVDHIIPISWFNLLKEEELIACWDLANLRHLEAITNIKRRNKMTPDEIDFMKANHPEIFYAASRTPHLVKKNRRNPLIPFERQLKLALFI